MKYIKIKLFFLLFCPLYTFAQVYTDKIVGKKNEALRDSLEVQKYPYLLPIWGEKVAQKGYQLPYSAGISINYFWQESDLDISNLNVGFNNGPQYNLDQIVRFNSSVASANAVSIRPDVWLLPFLNVYAILGKANTSTTINAGIWIPDASNNWSEVASFSTKANFNATNMGIGMTPTIGIGGGWLALDMNVTWTDIEALEKPAFAFVFGPRLGKTFKLKKAESNIAVWAGAFRVHLKSETKGSINLADVLPLDNAQAKVDSGLEKVAQNQASVNAWWDSLTNAEQANPINAAKYNTANKAFETAGNFFNSLDGALSTAGSSTVQYSLEKAPADKWNFILGTQYQYNKHIMLRAEYGFLGSRKQFLTSLQYRFGL
jgi:hypothetical protein